MPKRRMPSLRIRGINEPCPDDVATIRPTYAPVFDVARATGNPAEDFQRDITRLRGNLLAFVPVNYRSFVERLAKEAVVPSPDIPEGRLLLLSDMDWSHWERLALFVRDMLALHTAASHGSPSVQRLSRMVQKDHPELVSSYSHDRKSRLLKATTDRIDAMPMD